MVIKEVETFILDVPFHEVPQRNMERNLNGWHIVEMCRVTTEDGLVGYGETLPHYTWGRVSDAAKEKVKGKSAFDLLWDSSLGAGLQMALFDVAGKAAGVPAYKLMGTRHREWCPISWWMIDGPAEDYAAQAKDAVEQGYTSFKQKPRPWFDVYEQVRQTAEAVHDNFKIDLDFNGLLVNAANAVPILKELEKCPKVAFFESPIPQADVMGNKRIRQQTRCAIAMHYGDPSVPTAMQEEICDGFVIGGGASDCLNNFAVAAAFNKPGWLQLVGTGFTTTFGLHLGAVCSHAQWPMISCLNMYVDQLITRPIEVKGGYAKVPEEPGLGIEFNEDALKYKVDTIDKPAVSAIYAMARANGEKIWFAGEGVPGGYWGENEAGNTPVFEHGVTLERWDKDGSQDWQDLADRLKEGPVRSFL